MASLIDTLMEQLGGSGAITQVASRLGVDDEQASGAVGAAVPAILAGLVRNSQKPDGATALHNALQQHDGSVFDDTSAYFGDSQRPVEGGKILGHVFGEQKGQVQGQVAALSGLNAGQGGQVMAMLAPLIMGFLGKQQGIAGLDANGLSKLLGGQSGDLSKMLEGPLGQILAGVGSGGKGGGGLGGILGKLLGRR